MKRESLSEFVAGYVSDGGESTSLPPGVLRAAWAEACLENLLEEG